MERNVIAISVPAAADLSARQHRLVKVDTSGRAALADGTATPLIGVLGDKGGTAAGLAAQVQIAGVVKVYAGASVTAGDLVTSDGAGCGITCAANATGSHVIGKALETAQASANLFEVLINPFII
jgi:hypothetical protein